MKRNLLTFLFAVLFSMAFLGGKVSAAPDPVPPPGRIPCLKDQTEDPNFNSSRPYQASPCGDAPKATMCGNTLQVIETTRTITATQGTKFLGEGDKGMPITMERKTYSASLTGAEFPIAGNTELPLNSQNTNDQIDNANKVNEYLSWYLTGTTDKAEYGTTNPADIANFSGPIKKLLPGIIQDAQRIETLKLLTTSQTYSPDDTPQNPGDVPGPSGPLTTDQAITHNQIVVCTQKALPFLPLWLTNFFGIGSVGLLNNVPTECYPSAGSKASGTVYRLGDWQGESRLVDIIQAAGPILAKIIPSSIISQAVRDAVNHWSKNYPPLPWADENGQPFATPQDYQKAYNEWRGNLCTYFPNPVSDGRILVCAGAWPIITNPYADLYKYVPLSNTVDKKSKLPIIGVGIKGEQGTELDFPDPTKYIIVHEPILYYPHTAEVSEASNFLNQTYIPKEGTTSDPVPETTETVNDPLTGKCRILDLRTNPGDYLFPEVPPSLNEVNVDVHEYKVVKIPCHDVTRTVTRIDPVTGLPVLNPATGHPVEDEITVASCQGTIAIDIRMQTKVPYADEIYNSTTAGANSTFRRIFPKVQSGAPISCVSNLPSVTNVQYIPKLNMDGLKVIDPLDRNTTDNPQLYFPHFGSVYDLFLKGIQTALRPQGFGEPLVNGKFCTTAQNISCDKVAQDYGVPSCQLEGIMQLETGRGTNMGTESCGNFKCCSGGVCGPAQIKCGDYQSVSGGENIDLCDPCGASELLARLMKMKLCQAAGQCNSYDWNAMKGNAMKFNVKDGDYTAACYFYGLQNGCFPTACTQYRWGAGKSYGDAVKSMCQTGNILPDNPSPQFCLACQKEDPRVQCTP